MFFMLLPFPDIGIPPIPFSNGVTAAPFHKSFTALAFSVAAPRRATYQGPYTHCINCEYKDTKTKNMKNKSICILHVLYPCELTILYGWFK